MGLSVSTPAAPAPPERDEVRALAVALEERYGNPPLSDQALTQLSSPAVRHVVARDGDRLVGYGQLAGDSLEVAADAPVAGAVLDGFGSLPPGTLIWMHGERSPLLPALEARGGARPVRVLLRLARQLGELAPPRQAADRVVVRTFVVGQDEAAWVRVNARAFAEHHEQGRWTAEDLRAREVEDWFDPDGFFLAERDGVLLGYHWTKVHADGAGEVYVLGVDPDAQGLGLGGALLDAGLNYLAARGCREVTLYADESNGVAVRLYEASGFHVVDRDLQWEL